MAYQAQVTFERQARLTGSAYRALRGEFQGHDFRREIESGVSECWKVNQGQLWLITRIESRELVVCCAAGRGLVDACIYLLAAAKQQGLSSIRFHTYKPSMVRLIKRHFPRFRQTEKREGGEMVLKMGVCI